MAHGVVLYCTTITTTVSRPFVRDYPGEPVPEETFTRSHEVLSCIRKISSLQNERKLS